MSGKARHCIALHCLAAAATLHGNALLNARNVQANLAHCADCARNVGEVEDELA